MPQLEDLEIIPHLRPPVPPPPLQDVQSVVRDDREARLRALEDELQKLREEIRGTGSPKDAVPKDQPAVAETGAFQIEAAEKNGSWNGYSGQTGQARVRIPSPIAARVRIPSPVSASRAGLVVSASGDATSSENPLVIQVSPAVPEAAGSESAPGQKKMCEPAYGHKVWGGVRSIAAAGKDALVSGVLCQEYSSSEPTSSAQSSVPTSVATVAGGAAGSDYEAEVPCERETYEQQVTCNLFDGIEDMTSASAIAHREGRCTPCWFVLRKKLCTSPGCSFCHFVHEGSKKTPYKLHPCKGQRDRYNKHVARFKMEVERAPWDFDPNMLELPPSIAGSIEVKEKLFGKLQAYRDDVCQRIVNGEPLPSEEAAAAETAAKETAAAEAVAQALQTYQS